MYQPFDFMISTFRDVKITKYIQRVEIIKHAFEKVDSDKQIVRKYVLKVMKVHNICTQLCATLILDIKVDGNKKKALGITLTGSSQSTAIITGKIINQLDK